MRSYGVNFGRMPKSSKKSNFDLENHNDNNKCYLKLYFIGEEIDEEESVSEAGQDEEEEEDIPDEQTFLTKEITMEDIKRYETWFFLSYQERDEKYITINILHTMY